MAKALSVYCTSSVGNDLFKIGAILNPLNPSFNSQQVISALNHLESSHLIIGAETNLSRKPPKSNESLLSQIVPNIKGSKLESEVCPSLTQVVVVDNSEGRVDTSTMKATVASALFLLTVSRNNTKPRNQGDLEPTLAHNGS